MTRFAAALTLKLLVLLAAGAHLSGCAEDVGEPPAGAAIPPSAGSSAPAAPTFATPTESGLHRSVLTLDTHVDIPFNFATAAVDPRTAPLQVNLEKMMRGGLDAAFFIVYVGQATRTAPGYEAAGRDALTKFDAIRRMTEEMYPELIGLAYTPDDIVSLNDDGKLAAAIGIENGFVIGRNLDLLDRYYDLGARYMTLVHNGHNDLADSAQPREDLGDGPTEHGGLSAFGAQVVERMNDLGMMVDISHASKASALDMMRGSRAPVIASHSSVYGLAAHPRNLDDESLLALRDNGGVVQITAFDIYLRYSPEGIAADAELRARYGVTSPEELASLPVEDRNAYLQRVQEIQQQWPPSTIEDLVDHIDYAVELIGIDHVGISSDFGGGGGVIGWSDAEETPAVTAALSARGYSAEDIEKLWSGNLLRVWREVERSAAGAR